MPQMQLVRSVANTARGRQTTIVQRKQILQLVQELENNNPTTCAALAKTAMA